MSGAEHETDVTDVSGQSPDVGADAPAAVRRWQGQLLDLSMRNPLINLGDTGVSLFVDDGSLAAVENVVAEGVPLTVRGAEDLDELEVHDTARGVHDLDPDTLLAALNDGGLLFAHVATRQLRTALADLRRRAQLAHEELGTGALYLTLGALRITTDTGGEALAPLLLLPITLTGQRLGPHTIQLEPGAAVRANECLLEWLRRTNGFEPQVLMDPPLDGSGIDVPRLFAELRAALEHEGLPFEVVPDARIALLRFSTMQMWRDVHDHWRTFCSNPLVEHLAAGSGASFADPVERPEFTDAVEADLSLPLPADGSQMQAVAWAAAGCTFVLEGPPGTGKSQTITNVIAHALHHGKRVLFVAEKQAALEVVARRLRQVGLDGVCLDLHGKDRTSRDVRARLRAASEREPRDENTQREETAELAELFRRRGALIAQLRVYPRAIRGAAGRAVELDSDRRSRTVREYVRTSAELRRALRDQIAETVVGRAHDDDGAATLEALKSEVRTAHATGLAEFVSDHIEAILQVTPCLLMSPATVAQFLPARADLFDLVVFDESSQIRVSAAVGALGRARAAVIVGDAQQMPPSELFTVSRGTDEEGDDGGEQESILLEAHRAGLPSLRLDRHYRSRSEGLVTFSNRHYYDGGLATFPSPPGSRTDSGVEIRRVAGSFEQGRGGRKLNIIEANEVIDAVRAVCGEHPEASVGVITFNTSQAEYILEKLEADTSEQVRAALARDDEPLFVKNLENVQGDERDYIFFSLTYSLGADGRLPTNFGLLSRKGGERRLNVALTRARVRNVLFCSFDPLDIADSGEASRGPEHLREYLQAAQSGELMVSSVGEVAPDEYREAVARRLREAGAEVIESVGLSSFRVDVAARMPEGRWVAVQLDTPAWAARTGVTDRDELPEAVLVDGMGWAAFTHVYRPAWNADPDALVDHILDLARRVSGDPEPGAPLSGDTVTPAEVASRPAHPADPEDAPPHAGRATPSEETPQLPESLGEILAALSTDGEKVVLPPDVARAVAEQAASVRRLTQTVSSGAAPERRPPSDDPEAVASGDEPQQTDTPTLSAFVPASETQRADRSVIQALPSPEAAAQVEAQWREVVAAEGPVLVERALRIVAQRFGWRHLMAHRRNAVLECLPADLHRTRAAWAAEAYLWPPGVAPEHYREVRGASRADRKIAEIAPHERANAIRLVLAESGGRCAEGQLARGVSEVFGFGRFGGMSRGQLRDDLVPLVDSGEVRIDGGHVESTGSVGAVKPTR